MTCRNSRQEYPVKYSLSRKTFELPGEGEWYTIYKVRKILGDEIVGVTNDGVMNFRAYISGRKRIEFFKEGFFQTDYCH